MICLGMRKYLLEVEVFLSSYPIVYSLSLSLLSVSLTHCLALSIYLSLTHFLILSFLYSTSSKLGMPTLDWGAPQLSINQSVKCAMCPVSNKPLTYFRYVDIIFGVIEFEMFSFSFPLLSTLSLSRSLSLSISLSNFFFLSLDHHERYLRKLSLYLFFLPPLSKFSIYLSLSQFVSLSLNHYERSLSLFLYLPFSSSSINISSFSFHLSLALYSFS